MWDQPAADFLQGLGMGRETEFFVYSSRESKNSAWEYMRCGMDITHVDANENQQKAGFRLRYGRHFPKITVLKQAGILVVFRHAFPRLRQTRVGSWVL
jgi:hypothetical protein